MESSETLTETDSVIMSKNHSRIARRLNVLFTPAENQFDILPGLELELSTGKSKPDICIYPKLDYDWEKDVVWMTDPPICTIEILSPKQAINDLIEKIRDVYFPAGVQSAWLVVPPLQTVYVYYPGQERRIFSGGLVTDEITGIKIELAQLFA